jgi:hypothetical protein
LLNLIPGLSFPMGWPCAIKTFWLSGTIFKQYSGHEFLEKLPHILYHFPPNLLKDLLSRRELFGPMKLL